MPRLLPRTLGTVAALALCAATASAGSVTPYSFTGVTFNSAGDTATAEEQMRMTVELQGSEACFTFNNAGPESSSIVNIYFDDDLGLLDSLAGFTNSDGVNFVAGGNPNNLPGGNSIDFDADFVTRAASRGGRQNNGVNPDEWVKLTFDLTGTGLFDALNNDDLRVGLHIQGFASGGSESLVSAPNAVPTPTAAAAGLLGLAGVAGRRRQR